MKDFYIYFYIFFIVAIVYIVMAFVLSLFGEKLKVGWAILGFYVLITVLFQYQGIIFQKHPLSEVPSFFFTLFYYLGPTTVFGLPVFLLFRRLFLKAKKSC
jgi:hypothetical protein